MAKTLPRIWFERAIEPDLQSEVAGLAEVLVPAQPAQEPLQRLGEAEGALAGLLTYDGALMDRAPDLKVISRTGIGFDKVDLAAATERNIAVCNTPDGPTVSTAEQAMALILATAKRLKRSQQWLLDGEKDMYARHEALELDGKTLGLVGYGRIPRRVAAAAHGLGMHVVAYDPHLAPTAFAGAERCADIATLVATADVVSAHVPLTEETRLMFGRTQFESMKPGSIFINTARGGIVDQEALLEALDAGRLMAAGLDVTDPEPLPAGHPLLNRDDVVVTPHVASGTSAGKRRIFRMALQQALEVLRGEQPQNLLNPEVWPALSGRLGET